MLHQHKTVTELNKAQKEYIAARKQAIELTKQIQRTISNQPPACNGNWGLVGDAKHTLDQLQSILDDLNG